MKISKLFTYSFDPNVGPIDRVFRIISGAALAVLPWIGVIAVPQVAAIVMTVFGTAWFMTGAVSRCGMYYMLGLSSKKA
ncbi:DUF2892 domain-containing protein [Yoonia sp. SDW83-1]|uniref:YgaP family membrane protein n=1 Tax=Yoonia sp. SDW83-1 TaxID=3366945 RepID=UPI00398C4794